MKENIKKDRAVGEADINSSIGSLTWLLFLHGISTSNRAKNNKQLFSRE